MFVKYTVAFIFLIQDLKEKPAGKETGQSDIPHRHGDLSTDAHAERDRHRGKCTQSQHGGLGSTETGGSVLLTVQPAELSPPETLSHKR